MDEAQTCSFKGCREPRWADDPNALCLFHSPLNGRDDASARAVWERARAKCQEGRADFRGWHFPRDRDERDFTDAKFQGTTRFDDAAFEADARFERAQFHGAASFKGATFGGAGWFENTVFHGAAWFDNASFAGDAGFNAAQFHGPVRFGGAAFQASARFNAASFAANAEFGGARFQGNAWFDDASFQGDARFAAAAFEGKLTIFAAARFLGNAAFTDACFHHVASFKGVGFRGDARFHGATFRGEVSFRGVDWAVGKEVDFDLPFWRITFRKPTPFHPPEEGEEAYRLAKQSATARGDYAAAGEYHYAERCAMEHKLRAASGRRLWHPRFWRSLFELVFARGVFGYGERPSRALLIAFAVIALWALMAWGTAGITRNLDSLPDYQATLMQCLHFSVVTFTTVGYGDFVPKPGFRVLADAEAILGASLMAVFIVGLTRKYMR